MQVASYQKGLIVHSFPHLTPDSTLHFTSSAAHTAEETGGFLFLISCMIENVPGTYNVLFCNFEIHTLD